MQKIPDNKKGCSPDKFACEGFFGRMKNEMFYNGLWQGVLIQTFILENKSPYDLVSRETNQTITWCYESN